MLDCMSILRVSAEASCELSVAVQMRVMPNTPCLIGQAASAYVLGTHATDDDAQKTYALMSSVGASLQLSGMNHIIQTMKKHGCKTACTSY